MSETTNLKKEGTFKGIFKKVIFGENRSLNIIRQAIISCGLIFEMKNLSTQGKSSGSSADFFP